MGAQDTSTKDYLSDADIFADAVNYYLYGGETVVKPDSLKPLDSSLLLHIFSDEDVMNKGRAKEVERMHRSDRLLPVITICIYFGPEPWDGALILKELFDLPDERLLLFVQDYRVLLIEPSQMTEEDFERFTTSLGDVLRFMKAAQEREKNSIIRNSIEIYREMVLPEADIRQRIMLKYTLTEQEADSLMRYRSA